MFIEMNCQCMANMQIETEENESLAVLWAQKFVEAHESCGYMAPTKVDTPEVTKRYDISTEIKRREKE